MIDRKQTLTNILYEIDKIKQTLLLCLPRSQLKLLKRVNYLINVETDMDFKREVFFPKEDRLSDTDFEIFGYPFCPGDFDK